MKVLRLETEEAGYVQLAVIQRGWIFSEEQEPRKRQGKLEHMIGCVLYVILCTARDYLGTRQPI